MIDLAERQFNFNFFIIWSTIFVKVLQQSCCKLIYFVGWSSCRSWLGKVERRCGLEDFPKYRTCLVCDCSSEWWIERHRLSHPQFKHGTLGLAPEEWFSSELLVYHTNKLFTRWCKSISHCLWHNGVLITNASQVRSNEFLVLTYTIHSTALITVASLSYCQMVHWFLITPVLPHLRAITVGMWQNYILCRNIVCGRCEHHLIRVMSSRLHGCWNSFIVLPWAIYGKYDALSHHKFKRLLLGRIGNQIWQIWSFIKLPGCGNCIWRLEKNWSDFYCEIFRYSWHMLQVESVIQGKLHEIWTFHFLSNVRKELCHFKVRITREEPNK